MLCVRGLHKSYNSASVLSDVSFDLKESEILFLVGPSGVGKTTALRLIANLDPADGGIVQLNGKTPADLGYAKWRREVMYVPQHRITSNCTPEELFRQTLAFRSRASDDIDTERDVQYFVHICESMGLTAAQVASQKWSELSGASRPKVLLLDEPSSSCDHDSALLVEKAILDSGISSVWVSHDVRQTKRVGGTIYRMSVGVESC